MWEELWKSPEIQWLPLKYFLTHHLEFDYEVNRFEFAPVMFFFFFLSHWFQVPSKHVSVFFSNDNDKCSQKKKCHEKHTKYFSDKKKNNNLNPILNFISDEKLCSVGGRKQITRCPTEALIETCRGLEIWLFQWISDLTREYFLRKKKH